MHTVLGANGIIGEELAKALRSEYTGAIRLVGRNPQKVHVEDELVKADLLDAASVVNALEDTDITYLTVGLPYKSGIWLKTWPIILRNVIVACRVQECKLVYFDNTYGYSQSVTRQLETTPLNSDGKKGKGKKIAAELLLNAMAKEEIEGVICRAPEFYGPGKTKGITNTLIFENLRKGKPLKVFLKDDMQRTLIYTPDASKAMALIGNTPNVYGQTWHLPCNDNRLTYNGFIQEISKQLGRKIDHKIVPKFLIQVASLFDSNAKETLELLPRYEIDNIFESEKFKQRFPDFKVTSYQEGIAAILKDFGIQ